MNHKYLLAFSLILSSIMLLSSCKNSIAPTEPNSKLNGNLWGIVNLIQENHANNPSSEGVSVTIEGTTLSTTTDSIGYWRFTNLKSGVYNIMFSKQGYGTTKLIKYNFVPSDTMNSLYNMLFQIPDYYISVLHATELRDSIEVSGKISENTNYSRYAMLFYSLDSTVDYNNYNLEEYLILYPDSSTFDFTVTKNLLHDSGLQSGSIVYLAAYTYTGLTAYTDSVSGKLVYTSFSHKSTKVSFIAP